MTDLTTSTELQKITTGLESFEQRKQTLQELAEQAKAYTEITDKKSFESVSAFRKSLKSERKKIEKEGKAMRDILTPVSRAISAKETELIAIIDPQEERLQNLEKAYEAEQLAIKAEKERKEKERIQSMIDQLHQYGAAIDYIVLIGLTDEQFNERLEQAKKDYEAEQARLAEEKKKEEERIAEEKRKAKEQQEKEAQELAKQQAELEKQKAEQKAEQERQEANARELARQRKEIEDAKAELEAKAKRAAKAEQERLAAIEAEKKAQEQKELDEKRRAEREAQLLAARPDIEKLEAVIESCKITAYDDAEPTFANPEIKDIAVSFSKELAGLKQKYFDILKYYKA